MYVFQRVKSVDKVRLIKLEATVKGKLDKILKSANIDLSRIPLCWRCLIPHIRRVNYRLAQLKQSHLPFVDLSPPTHHGWAKWGDDVLDPVWSERPFLPESFLGIVESYKSSVTEDNDEEESDEEDTVENNEFNDDDNEEDCDLWTLWIVDCIP